MFRFSSAFSTTIERGQRMEGERDYAVREIR
jgi:hypothetical protein